MQFLNYIEYSVSPTIKILICVMIGISLFVVYIWDPDRRKKESKKTENTLTNYVEVNPQEIATNSKLMKPKGRTYPHSNATLEHLDEYVKSVREYHINSLDEV